MNAIAKKILLLLMVPALAAGAFFIAGFSSRLPRGVRVNGVDVGGMGRAEAVEVVRADIVSDLKGRKLEICSPENVYAFSYPEISFRDDVRKVISSVRSGGDYAVNAVWYLNCEDSVISGICAAEFRQKAEPEAVFNGGEGQAFTYKEGRVGARADSARLKRDIDRSLAARKYGGEFEKVKLSLSEVRPEKTLEELKKKTARLSAYTTYFDCNNAPRVSNIKLAGVKISGCVLEAGETFSFNGRVGARTKQNGFKDAKVILDGKYVYGTGGGVCQVSTTLYNAALLAGLRVTEYHPHSLAVGYVSPSRDAMVSGTYCDLKFVNTCRTPVYIRVLTGMYYVRCEIYGLSDGTEYSLSSVVLDDGGGKEGAEGGGVKSECYITETRGGQSVTRLLRKDSYLPVRSSSQGQEEKNGESGAEESAGLQEDRIARKRD